MKIATWNVNSIRSRLDRVLPWLERERPDALCLQEVKTTDELFPREPFEALGYAVETHGQKTYNGVAILARLPPSEVRRGLPGEGPDAQSRLIEATVGGLRLVCAYVPNGQAPDSEKFRYKLDWLERLASHLAETGSPKDRRVVLGDFNIAPDERDVEYVERWRGKVHFHPKEHEALAKILGLGFQDLFRKHHQEGGSYTWWDYRRLAFPKNDGLRIDLALGTKPVWDGCTGSEIHRDERKGESPSDHVPVVLEV